MYIDCESVYSPSSAVKQTSETLRKTINPVPLFYLCWLHPQLPSLSQNESLQFGEKQISVNRSDLLAINQPLRLRFLTALNTSSWKVFWSKGDSSHFENYPSSQISWTYRDVFQIKEKFIHNCPPCLLAEMAKSGKLSSQASKMLYNIHWAWGE